MNSDTIGASNGVKKPRFKAKVIAPYFTKAPAEEVEKWAKNIIASSDKAYKHSKERIKTKEDFNEKIAKPSEQGFDKFLEGLPPAVKQRIMFKIRDSQEKAAKRYLQKREETYQTSKYANSIEAGKKQYEESWIKFLGPLRGEKKSKTKGLGSLGAMALSADKDLKKFLKKDADKIIEGEPICVTSPDKASKFRNDVRNLIIRLGGIIIGTGYLSETIQNKNEELNQLVEQYRAPEIAPFKPSGDSHIDFIVVEIPNPAKPDEMIKQLGLEIQINSI